VTPGPTLALCIPAFNASQYLPRLFASARAQTAPFDEILVYDDCSADDTVTVAEAFGVDVIRGEVNRGPSFGRNRLAETARSDWIHFHDADDYLYPHFVEVARKWMTPASTCDVVMIAYEVRDEAGIKRREHQFDDWALRIDPIRETILELHVNCGIYRREMFVEAGGFDADPKVLYNEDDAMHCQLARAGLRFRAESTVSAVVIERSGSMSRDHRGACFEAKYHLLEKSVRLLPARYHGVIARKLWRMAGVCGMYYDWKNADRCVGLARKLGYRLPPEGSIIFRSLCCLAPHLAVRVRAAGLRVLWPHLRKEYDRGWTNGAGANGGGGKLRQGAR
jgi:glycosyltransferase involved in cell wall biosynthesis